MSAWSSRSRASPSRPWKHRCRGGTIAELPPTGQEAGPDDAGVERVAYFKWLLASWGFGWTARTVEAGANPADTGKSMMSPQRLTDGFQRQWSGPLPRIGLFGEFSAGKSSVINLLLGRELLPAAVLSSTRRPTMIRHAPELSIEAIDANGARSSVPRGAMATLSRTDISRFEIGMPGPLLRHLELLDTAGFADPYQDHRPTLEAVESVDVCVWCTLATQAWRDSEQKTWLGLPPRLRERGILVATHADSITRVRDLQRVRTRLQREAGELFASIVLLAVPDAMRSQGDGGLIADPGLWRTSGGADLLAAMQRAAASLAELRKKDDGTAQEAQEAQEQAAKPRRRALSALERLAGAASLSPPAAEAPITETAQPQARTFLSKVLAELPTCLSALWIDLRERRVVDCCGAGAEETTASASLGGAISDFFQGGRVEQIERLFKQASAAAADDRHYFQEIVLIAPDCLGIMLRSPADPDRALIVIADKAASLGLVLTTVRGLLAPPAS